jgi:integrase
LALELAYHTGHRIGAVRHLRWEDVDLESRTLFWSKDYDKQGKDHWTPLPEPLFDTLKACKAEAKGPWVLPFSEAVDGLLKPIARGTLVKFMQRMVERIGLKRGDRYGWHSLRRQFATELYQNVSMSDLCALGGWQSSKTVELCYIKPSLDSMRSALQRRKVG